MKEDIISINSPANNPAQLMTNILIVNLAAHQSNGKAQCNYRAANGYCTSSNRPCPATHLTYIFNN